MADFDLLLAEAHKRGIGVIIDYVINHSSNQHPLFANASSSALNPQRDYFVWQTSKPSGWSVYGADPWYASSMLNGYYFAGFWSGMPDFNWKSTKVENFHHDNLRFWLNKGVDGMRFDAVGNLVENGAGAWESQPENHAIMNKVRTLLGSYSQRYMVCESPAAPWAFAASNSCGSAFAFNLQGALLGAAKGQATSIQTLSQYFVSAPQTLATFLSNHDRFAGDRVWNQLGGNVAQYKLAAASYLLLPGTPFIYYGEEVGMANAQSLGGDWAIRTPMNWTGDKTGFTSGTPFRTASDNLGTQNAATQVGVAGSLHSFYKEMLALRNRFPSIAQGSYESPFVTGVSGQVMGYQRKLGSETTLVLINYGSSATVATVNGLAANAKLAQQYGGIANLDANATGQASVSLPAQSVSVFLLK
jgi:glycosidase